MSHRIPDLVVEEETSMPFAGVVPLARSSFSALLLVEFSRVTIVMIEGYVSTEVLKLTQNRVDFGNRWFRATREKDRMITQSGSEALYIHSSRSIRSLMAESFLGCTAKPHCCLFDARFGRL